MALGSPCGGRSFSCFQRICCCCMHSMFLMQTYKCGLINVRNRSVSWKRFFDIMPTIFDCQKSFFFMLYEHVMIHRNIRSNNYNTALQFIHSFIQRISSMSFLAWYIFCIRYLYQNQHTPKLHFSSILHPSLSLSLLLPPHIIFIPLHLHTFLDFIEEYNLTLFVQCIVLLVYS